MIYSLLILSSPNAGACVHTAALFAKQVLRQHNIHRVFFLDAGTATASSASIYTQEEVNPSQLWVELAQEHQIDLTVCVTSALRYGILDEREARQHDRSAITLHPAFSIGGLGLLVDAIAQSDRLITFGGP